MTKQEHIEEMAKKMYTSVFCEPTCECCKHKKSCIRYRYAERLYNAGYRKGEVTSYTATINGMYIDQINQLGYRMSKMRKETAKEIISFIESKDKIGGKYSIYAKLLQELKEKYGEVE